MGTIEERKNQIRLVEAFSRIQQTSINLVIVGRPTDYAQKLRQRIDDLKLGKRVILLHDVPSENLPALYQGARVFAYVSLFEGFGIPIVEALHSGIPVLAASGSCLQEAGGLGALYTDPLNSEEMAFQLNQLMNDEDLRQQIKTAGQHHVQQFSSQKIANQLVGIYSKLLL